MAGPIAFLVPDPIQSTQLIPGGNTPASGGLLFVYQVGSSTKQNSFTDPSASTARTNPIVLDSGGNIPGNGEVWITSTAKFVLAPSNDTDPPSSPYWSKDNYPGINNITAAQVQALSAQSEWVQGSTATFVGVTGFSVVGDQTALYTLGRRVKATVTGGDRFGIVTSAVLSTGSTAVGVTLDSGTLNGGLSVISYGILSTPNGSVPWTQETSSGALLLGGTTTQALTAFTLAITSNVLNFTQASTASIKSPDGTLLQFLDTTSALVRNLTIAAANSSGTVTLGITGGRTLAIATSVSFGATPSTSGVVNIAGGQGVGNGIWASAATSEAQLIALNSDLYAMTGGGGARGSVMQVVVSSGPPTILNLPTGFFACWKDTSASTVRFYYNDGSIHSTAAFS